MSCQSNILILERNDDADEPEKCPNVNEIYQETENYNFVTNFGESFTKLKNQIHFTLPSVSEEMKAVYFIGNTGSGKSTLVQILGADNSKLLSKATNPETDDFTIVDDKGKIGIHTIHSETLFPDFLVDPKSKYILVDNPGFRDTRSSIHEILATYSIKKSLKNISKIKIVITVTHASLIPGNYREDFINVLKHVLQAFVDIKRYKNSFYLIATKTENRFKTIKGKIVQITDDSVINSIGFFLKEVKTSLQTSLSNWNTEKEKMIQIIDILLEQKMGNIFNRIRIIRRPMEEGPLSSFPQIQEEREAIRKLLLNDENLVKVDEKDFGFPLSDGSKLYLNELFQKFNSYMWVLSKAISNYLAKHYKSLMDSYRNIDLAVKKIQEIQSNFTMLLSNIKKSTNPETFVGTMNRFSADNNLKTYCFYSYKDIHFLNEFLIYFENISPSAKYLPSNWEIAKEKIISQLSDKLAENDFYLYIVQLLTSYSIQKDKNDKIFALKNETQTIKSDTKSIQTFLEKYKLNVRFRNMNIDGIIIKKLNNILDVTLNHKMRAVCGNDTLLISDYIIVLSVINMTIFKSCAGAKNIVIIAAHTIFIDKDLTEDFFSGKNLIVIAPLWDVIGNRTIRVDGKGGGSKLSKSGFGEIGANGQNGQPGGVFLGIGMIFNRGEYLTITARGGDGQDGGDGGDGQAGVNGTDGTYNERKYYDSDSLILLLINLRDNYYDSYGSNGTRGGDSGAGGKGGNGGEKGYIHIHSVLGSNPGIIMVDGVGKKGSNGIDGKPGVGGKRGCDKRYEEDTIYFLFIPVYRWYYERLSNCYSPPINGTVRKHDTSEYNISGYSASSCYNRKLCKHILNYLKYFAENFYRNMSDGIIEKFINAVNLKNISSRCS